MTSVVFRQVFPGGVIAVDPHGELARLAGAQVGPRCRAAGPTAGADRLLPVAAFLEEVELWLFRIAIDDPYLGDSKRRVEGQLLVSLVAGTVDFNDGVRRAFEVLVVVNAEALGRQHE